MNSEKIIEADRKFVRKLHQLRSTLDGRQKKNQKMSLTQVLNRSLVLIIAILIITTAGYAIIHKKHNLVSDRVAETENTQVSEPQKSGPITERRAGIDNRHTETESHDHPGNIRSAPTPPAVLSHVPVENKKSKVEKGGETFSSAGSAFPDADLEGVELVSAVACSAVKNRIPFDGQNVFYLSDTSRAYVWMKIISIDQPFVVKHIYYLNGRKYSEVPLDIKYPHMRTWSYVSLQTKKQVGKWRVEIVCAGRALKTLFFIVRDGDDHSG